MDFSERLRNARHSKNLTQQQLADALNVDRTAIAHYERGTASPHFDNIHKLCELLDLTYEDIFNE